MHCCKTLKFEDTSFSQDSNERTNLVNSFSYFEQIPHKDQNQQLMYPTNKYCYILFLCIMTVAATTLKFV